uniref:non-specific serine/threonine protein kinase n=1 Tax=Physarum polycephalum TaxID=5791 RepID=Q8WSQ3_PHYPO|nr:myosin light chain kinase [Physarum polycephalum]
MPIVMQQKSDFHNRYDIIARIGKGQFSTVYEAAEKATNEHWAGKVVINKTDALPPPLETELAILAHLDHPQTVRLKEVFNSDDVCIIVQELVNGGELFERISEQGVFSEKYANKFFRDLLLVVKYLHEQGIVHRDLKPENIMLSDQSEEAVLKLIDFGASKFAQHDKAINGVRGTPPYMAPEIFAYQSYGKPVDMWSLGVILYVILSGMFPYDPEERRFDCPFISPEFDEISESAQDILLKLMEINPEKRYTVDQALEHPWVTGEKASSAEMSRSGKRQMVARKKFKRAVETIRATNRFRNILKMKTSTPTPIAAVARRGSKLSQHMDVEKLTEQLGKIIVNSKEVTEQLGKVTSNLDSAEKLLQEASKNVPKLQT